MAGPGRPERPPAKPLPRARPDGRGVDRRRPADRRRNIEVGRLNLMQTHLCKS
jgi:hypothetical protein